MRALLSTIGSRGDVQPLVALAMELKNFGHEARICAPPDFREWVESFAIPFFPIGPEVRSTAKSDPGTVRTPPTAEQIKKMMDGTVATQFGTIPKAAEGCDVIVGANALQIAARSVAEHLGIGYVFVAYSPSALPSTDHAPPAVMAWRHRDAAADNRTLWSEDAARWTERWGAALNRHRASFGLAPVDDVRSHILTDHPWLACDETLGPWPASDDLDVFQTGAWILADERPLSAELDAFLNGGAAPVFFGFGSMRGSNELSKTMVDSARAMGRRAVISRGWADLELPDSQSDCLAIGEVNQQALFRRVAAVVHHGGAGTTTAATLAGVPQVVIPQMYDQPYWANQVERLGIGIAHAPDAPTTDSSAQALQRALQPEVADRARAVAKAVRTDGVRVAALRLTHPRA